MSLPPGSHIGRIRIDALIGAGGMGEVYRGWDERLERPVALKVIQPNKLVDSGVRSRFLREARLLSKLDHPNICGIYDVIEEASGNYLVLELIEGRTLRTAIAEGLAGAEGVSVAVQLARVLAFAHARGIIHRDLKPDNVMLTRDGEVKVLDFGLARLVQDDDSSIDETAELVMPEPEVAATEKTVLMERRTEPMQSIDWARTSAGTLVGTVHYMSPEQARGLPLTAASDLYSFGILLYELLNHGASPYGKTPSTTELLAKVRKADLTLTGTGDRDITRLVRGLTDPDPEERPDAEATVRELERIASRPQRVRRNAILAAVGATIIAVAVVAMFITQRLADRPLFTKHGDGKIAVLPFRNETNQRGTEWVELGLMDMVMQGLGGLHRVQLVPADDVLKAMKNLGIARTSALTPGARTRLLDVLGADTLLAATVTSSEGQYGISYRLLLRDGDEAPGKVSAATLPDAANDLTSRLAPRLDPAARRIDIRERYSFDDFANVAYAIGVQQFLTKGPQAAVPYFTVCIDRDPEFAWAEVQLARCSSLTGDVARTDALLDDARKLATRKGDRRLVAEIDLTRADDLIDRGQYADADRIARASLVVAQQLRDLKMAGHAQRLLGVVAWHQNRLDDARGWNRTALQTFTSLRSASDLARVYNNMGILEAEKGDSAAAERYYLRTLEMAEKLNDFPMTVKVLGNLASTRLDATDYPGAAAYARRQLTLSRKSGDRGNEIFGLVNLSIALWAMDHIEEALQQTQEAATIAAQIHNPRVEAIALVNIGFARTYLGQFDAAQRAFDQARAVSDPLGSPDVAQRVDANSAYLLTRRGQLDEAQRMLDRAEKVRVNLASLTARARLLYARGDYKGAEAAMKRGRDLHEGWLPTQQRMYEAYAESARTGRPSTIEFERYDYGGGR
ncbi:MAG: eukaryotic-like serine/threonine-protein kinase [Acidobacteriota bacterium]|jgi:tetratricopeptide (TPR) repeat protein|nr:eukaryotic-like serine/threonine-protein kinase [Acidobacteriota bacterium]